MKTSFAVMGLALALPLGAHSRLSRPVEHLRAKSAVMTSATRLTLRPVDIAIDRWPTFTDHRALETALLEKGPVACLNLLCGVNLVSVLSVNNFDE